MRSRRRLRAELDAMTERWVRAEGHALREKLRADKAVHALAALQRATDLVTAIDRPEVNPLAVKP